MAILAIVQTASAATKLDLFGVSTGVTEKEVTALAKEKNWECRRFEQEFVILCLVEKSLMTIYLAPYLQRNPVYQIKYVFPIGAARESIIASISANYGKKPEGYNKGTVEVVWRLNDALTVKLVNSSRIELLNTEILAKELEIQNEIIRRKKSGDLIRQPTHDP
jgi:hypothetical protein